MNLTAEQIDTIRWAYKNPDIDALADMAKRTLAAEAKVVEIDTENGLLKEKLTAARNELAALKNAGEPHDIAEFYKDEPVAAPDLVERLRNFPRFYTTDGIHWYKGDDKEPLCLEAAAALAEREKDAEKFIDEWKHLCCAVCAEVSLWTKRCPHCGMPAIDALRSRS